jgi:hypothetical protein
MNNLDLNVDKLMIALDNNKNESIMNLTTVKIQEMIFKILKELHLDRELMINYFKKLKGYKYVDELNDLKYGGFIRWIPITDPDYLPLNQCGIICDIIISDDGIYIVCKNFMHRHYRFKMDECLIFQKLTSQELIILNALDHLADEEKSKKKGNEKNNNNKKGNKIEEESDEDVSDELEEESDELEEESDEEESDEEEEDKKLEEQTRKNSKLNKKI